MSTTYISDDDQLYTVSREDILDDVFFDAAKKQVFYSKDDEDSGISVGGHCLTNRQVFILREALEQYAPSDCDKSETICLTYFIDSLLDAD